MALLVGALLRVGVCLSRACFLRHRPRDLRPQRVQQAQQAWQEKSLCWKQALPSWLACHPQRLLVGW